MRLTVRYFAVLRDQARCESERLEFAGGGLRALYGELAARHGFAMPLGRLRVALDGAFVDWDAPLRDGAEVAFIPPVSGG